MKEPVSEQNKALVDRLTRAFNEGNLDLLDELVAPNFVGHSPLSPEDIQGPEGLKGFFGTFRAAMPDIKHPHWTLIAEGDLVAIHTPIVGTFTNVLMSIPPTGEEVVVWMANIWRVTDGKVSEWWLNTDTLGLMQQLGAIPTPA
jgi:predicted SnoaL-like aldol condensation-catalyzing enzyme